MLRLCPIQDLLFLQPLLLNLHPRSPLPGSLTGSRTITNLRVYTPSPQLQLIDGNAYSASRRSTHSISAPSGPLSPCLNEWGTSSQSLCAPTAWQEDTTQLLARASTGVETVGNPTILLSTSRTSLLQSIHHFPGPLRCQTL